MLSHSDLKKGIRFILDKEPYEILESSFTFKGRGSSTVQAKIKNLITGNIVSKTFHANQNFEEAEISKLIVKFIYSHRDKFYFCEQENPSARFDLDGEQIGSSIRFLKQNQEIEALKFKDKIINISLPIKIPLKVIEAPPGFKGDRSQSGTKQVELETGARLAVPLFVEEGDIIEVNTETGEYTKRIEKG